MKKVLRKVLFFVSVGVLAIGCEKEDSSITQSTIKDYSTGQNGKNGTSQFDKSGEKTEAEVAVEALFFEFKDNVAESSIYTDFIDSHNDSIVADSNYVISESDIDDLIVNLGQELEQKLQVVGNLNLTDTEINSILLAINIANGSNNDGSFGNDKSCWICSGKACAVSMVLSNSSGVNFTGILGNIGVWVHC